MLYLVVGTESRQTNEPVTGSTTGDGGYLCESLTVF